MIFVGIVSAIAHFSLAQAQQPAGGKHNLLTNSSFEEDQGGWVYGWVFSSWAKKGTVTIDQVEKRQGKASIRIDNSGGDDSFLKRTVAVKPKTRYRLSGYIKVKDIVGKGGGPTLSLEGGFEKTEEIYRAKNWTKVSFEFDSGAADSVKVGPRIGHHGNMVMGTAWFDDLALVEIGPSRKR